MQEKKLFAPAKVNLTLDILRRRPDGYHDLRMVMQSISLGDTVTVRTGTGTGEIVVHAGRDDLPSGPENIAWKAAAEFFCAAGISNAGVEIDIEKNIPFAAGMAGGSADGAAVLKGLRDLLCPAMTDVELEVIGLQVGSDVPFCIRGGTALAEGRGEVLTELPSLPPCWLTVCKPDFGLSTPALFGRIRIPELRVRPDHAAVIAALTAGNLHGVARQMCNVFEEVLTPQEAYHISRIRETMLAGGALNAVMTGSGPAVFGIFETETAAQTAAEALRGEYAQTFTARPL